MAAARFAPRRSRRSRRVRIRAAARRAGHMLRWRPLRQRNAEIAGEFMTTTFDAIRAIIMRDFELPPERLQHDTLLEEIELDSLAITEPCSRSRTSSRSRPRTRSRLSRRSATSRTTSRGSCAERDAKPSPAPKRAAAKAKRAAAKAKPAGATKDASPGAASPSGAGVAKPAAGTKRAAGAKRAPARRSAKGNTPGKRSSARGGARVR